MSAKLISLCREFVAAPRRPRDVFEDNQKFFASFETIVDLGAHHGAITQKLKHLAPRSVIHAFEPFPNSYALLLKEFGRDRRVVLNNKAVTDRVGILPFYANVSDETNSLLSSASVDGPIDALTRTLGVVEVEATSIDTYANEKRICNIDFLKIDVQGSTFAVLEGAEQMLGTGSIKWIYAEVEFVEIYKNEKRFSEIELLLRMFGYELVRFYNLNYTQRGNLAWADALFRRGPQL